MCVAIPIFGQPPGPLKGRHAHRVHSVHTMPQTPTLTALLVPACVCLQDQVIGYFVFGLIRWEDRFAYLAGAMAGLVGCLIGHSVQKLMDQKQFSRVMTGLLLLCFCLMTASAAGWINVG